MKKSGKDYIDIIFKPEISVFKKEVVEHEDNLRKLFYFLAAMLDCSAQEKILLLQMSDIKKRIDLIIKLMSIKNDELKVAKELENKVRKEMSKENINNLNSRDQII